MIVDWLVICSNDDLMVQFELSYSNIQWRKGEVTPPLRCLYRKWPSLGASSWLARCLPNPLWGSLVKLIWKTVHTATRFSLLVQAAWDVWTHQTFHHHHHQPIPLQQLYTIIFIISLTLYNTDLLIYLFENQLIVNGSLSLSVCVPVLQSVNWVTNVIWKCDDVAAE